VTAPGAGPILVTERLRLVPYGPDDVSRLHAMLIDADVRRYLMDDQVVEAPWVVDLVEASRKTFAEASFGLWRLESRRDGAFVGLAGLRSFPGAREPQLVYALDRPFWGQGLATEAAAAVIDHAFEELGFKELLASTDSPNRASIRVMERLGMRFLEAGRVLGNPHAFYRMTRADWARARGRAATPAIASGAAGQPAPAS
jgi:[ribosomal protein S5]-alanine N-acetyltransferase